MNLAGFKKFSEGKLPLKNGCNMATISSFVVCLPRFFGLMVQPNFSCIYYLLTIMLFTNRYQGRMYDTCITLGSDLDADGKPKPWCSTKGGRDSL